MYSELTKTSTALPRLAVLSVLSAARRLVLIFVNPLYMVGEGVADLNKDGGKASQRLLIYDRNTQLPSSA